MIFAIVFDFSSSCHVAAIDAKGAIRCRFSPSFSITPAVFASHYAALFRHAAAAAFDIAAAAITPLAIDKYLPSLLIIFAAAAFHADVLLSADVFSIFDAGAP